MILGFLFVYDGYMGVNGLGGTTSTGSTTTVSTTSTTSTAGNLYTLTVKAVDQSGNPLVVEVVVDPGPTQVSGTTPTPFTLAVGTHTIACKALSGYQGVTTSAVINVPVGSYSSVLTCTYQTAQAVTVNMVAVDQNGAQINAAVYYNGASIGMTPVSFSGSVGGTVGCATPGGYQPVADSFTIGGAGTFSCTFTTTGGGSNANCGSTCSLIVTAEICVQSCLPQGGQSIQVLSQACYSSYSNCTPLASGLTGSNGQITFQIPANQGQVYVIWNSNSGQAVTAIADVTPVSVTVFGSPAGTLSIVGASIFGTSTTAVASELIVGLFLLIGGGTGFILSEKSKARL